MRKFTLLFLSVFSIIAIHAQTTWTEYPSKVLAFSSQYTTDTWSAKQALGGPNTLICNDIPTAWASLSADGQREYLVLGFSIPAQTNQIRIFQTYAAGAIDTVYLHDAGTDTWNTIYTATAAAIACNGAPVVLQIDFPTTSYRVDAIRIALNSPAVPSWNEIDAVAMRVELPATVKLSAQSGNWSNAATWTGGVAPGTQDTAIIQAGHIISENVTTNIKSLFIDFGGELDMGSVALILGPTGGGKEFLNVFGTLNNTGGNIAINGNAQFFNGSTFNMTAGHIFVDGNNGTAAGSVANGINLLQFDPGIALSFTGGVVTIVDPQYNSSGQGVAGNYTFGANTLLELGDNLSTTASNNPDGFGGSDVFPSFGSLDMDVVTSTGNRNFVVRSTMNLLTNLNVHSGTLTTLSYFTVGSNVINQSTIDNRGNFWVKNNLTNAGTITMNAGDFAVDNIFTNNPGSVYQVNGSFYTSVGRDLVNNGTFNSNWLYMGTHFSTSANVQNIQGSGSFNIFGLEILNSNPAGVSLSIPLTIQYLYFLGGTPGKLFLGNNDLTVQLYTYGAPGLTAYVVINGTGRLINENIGTSPVIIPVGTNDYTPVTLANGSGHSFAVGVRNTVTTPPSAPVNKEWNITDLTGGAVSATVTLQWNAADEDPSFTRNLCYVGHYNGASWDAVSPGATADGGNPYTRTATGVSTFSPFGVFSGGSTLPVHLLNFSAVKEGNQVKLTWQVDNETEMSGYEVERSNNARDFTHLSSLPALNQLSAHNYSLYDIQPPAGIVYYRLKELNKDGRVVYSSVARVDLSKLDVFVFPNPAKNKITVRGLNNFKKANLIDATGKTIHQWRIGISEQLDVSGISPGVYYLLLVNDKERQLIPFAIKR